MNHELKIWPSFFEGVASGVKPFELRKDDRDISLGDTVRFREWWPSDRHTDGGRFTGRSVLCSVSSVLRDFPGLDPSYCILGLQRLHEHASRDHDRDAPQAQAALPPRQASEQQIC